MKKITIFYSHKKNAINKLISEVNLNLPNYSLIKKILK